MKSAPGSRARFLFAGSYRGCARNWQRKLGVLIAATLLYPFPFVRTNAASSMPRHTTRSEDRPVLSEYPTVQAKGNGNPWISVGDGHELVTGYTGSTEVKNQFASDQLRPLSLAAADLDEDGVPDLVSGLATSDGKGIVAVYPGNVDAIYPNAPAARQRKLDGTFTDAPFLSPARLYDLPSAPDFLETGNFEGTKHMVVVAATRGSNLLSVMDGDGSGDLGAVSQIALPGPVTAMASGDVNRADGLKDIVVAIGGDGGPELLVFEGSEGALKSTPEAIPIPAEATSVGIGHLDDDFQADIAVTAGRDLIVVHGRDRMLSLDEATRRAVPPPAVSMVHFNSSLRSLTLGKFSADGAIRMVVLAEDGTLSSVAKPSRSGGRYRVADTLAAGLDTAAQMVRTRVSGMASDDLMIVDPTGHSIRLWMNEQEATIRAARLSLSSVPDRSRPTVFPVDGEPAAVLPMRLNGDALDDLVVLIAGHTGPSVMPTGPTGQQPTIFVTSTADSGPGTLRQAIITANGVAEGATIGFALAGSQVPTINLLSPLPPLTGTITIDGTTQGTKPGLAAIVTPQATGLVELNGQNLIPDAVIIQSQSNDVRGLVINRSGNGIQLTGGNNIIEGNLIGTDPTGAQKRANSGRGVFVNGSSGNLIGGTASAATNLISASQNGVEITGNASTLNQVELNIIGSDLSANPNPVLGNSGNGVSITNGASANTIGGSVVFAGLVANVIVSSGQDGINIGSGSANLVVANRIDSNGRNGVTVRSAGNTIGGPRNQTINAMWRSGAHGVQITTATNTLVQGNYIGFNFDTAGNLINLGNTLDGVNIAGASNNVIGGQAAVAGNIIAFNHGNGVTVATGNGDSILSDLIFSNTGTGISLGPTANDQLTAPRLTRASPAASSDLTSITGARATPAAASITIAGTLSGPPNANMLVQFFLGTACAGTGSEFLGTLPEVLGSSNITTDASGSATFSVSLALPSDAPPTGFVNASATDPGGSTSSFSQCTAFGVSGCNITCPANITTAATSSSGATVTYNAPVTAGCGTAAVTCLPLSGSVFPIGNTTVTCTVASTSVSCNFVVTVTSSAGPPVLINPAIQGKKFITTAAGSNIQAGAKLNIGGDIYPLTLSDDGSQWIVFKADLSIGGVDKIGLKFKAILNFFSGQSVTVFVTNPNGQSSASQQISVP